MSLDASSRVAMSASLNWMAWWWAMGLTFVGIVIGYLAIYLLVFLPRGTVG
jgi:hypothetical protein